MTSYILDSDVVEITELLGDDVNQFSDKSILICGGRGFLGRYFISLFKHINKNILSKPCKVYVLDNLITSGDAGSEISQIENFEFIEHDVIKPFKISDDVDYIIHAAGIASPFYYREYPLETLDVAIQGTRNMLDLAREKKSKVIFFSSSEIYGDPDAKHVPTQESYRGNVSCLGPRACYDESKRVGETLCRIYHDRYGVDVNMIRPFNVFGPGMQEKDYRVLPNFGSRIKGNLPVNIYGTGNQTRTYCYISDALTGFLKVLLKGVPGEPYNIGNPNPEISVIDIVATIEKVISKKIDKNIIEYPDSYPADEPNRRCPDIRKARLQLGYEPVVKLEEGLRRFFKWTEEAYVGES